MNRNKLMNSEERDFSIYLYHQCLVDVDRVRPSKNSVIQHLNIVHIIYIK